MTTTRPAFRPSTLADATEAVTARARALAARLPAALGRKLRGASKAWTVARAAKEAAAATEDAALREDLRALALLASAA